MNPNKTLCKKCDNCEEYTYQRTISRGKRKGEVFKFKVGNSTFQLTGDWNEGFRSEGGIGVERIRLDTAGKIIIMAEYSDKSKYLSESENAINTKKINGTACKMIPDYPAIVWFTKNGNYYHISVQNIDSSGNFEDGTEDDIKYIEEIVSTIQ